MEDRLDRSFETSKIPADKPLKDGGNFEGGISNLLRGGERRELG